MNLQQIEYVIAVSESRNFSHAANKCSITQSTLSTMIGRFEDEIGIDIFDRKTKPVTITKEGKLIIEQLKIISREINGLGELSQSLKGEMSGELKIGVIPTVAPYLLPRFLNDFASQFPKINFSVSEMVTDTIIDLLQKRELDVGIAAVPFQNENFVEIPLYNEPFILYDSSSGRSEGKLNIEEMDLGKLWLLEEGHCLHTQVKRICDLDNCKNKKGINFDFKAGSLDSLIRFVKTENGITLLPYLAALDLSGKEKNKLSELGPSVPVRKIGLVVHRHFVKKKILDLLQVEIKNKMLPLFSEKNNEEWVVSPF